MEPVPYSAGMSPPVLFVKIHQMLARANFRPPAIAARSVPDQLFAGSLTQHAWTITIWGSPGLTADVRERFIKLQWRGD